MSRLLVVDWDFFFPQVERPQDGPTWPLFDWGHNENQPMYYEAIWPVRAEAFFRHGADLPTVNDEWRTFWDRFEFTRHTELLFADSNMHAAMNRIARGVNDLLLFDAHHDSGYGKHSLMNYQKTMQVTCEDWMFLYAYNGAKMRMRYPRWRHYALPEFDDAGELIDGTGIEPEPQIKLDRAVDDGEPVPGVIDRVFVCKSPAWTPPWTDRQFHEFIDLAPVGRVRNFDDGKLLREWDEAATREMSATVEATIRESAEAHVREQNAAKAAEAPDA